MQELEDFENTTGIFWGKSNTVVGNQNIIKLVLCRVKNRGEVLGGYHPAGNFNFGRYPGFEAACIRSQICVEKQQDISNVFFPVGPFMPAGIFDISVWDGLL